MRRLGATQNPTRSTASHARPARSLGVLVSRVQTKKPNKQSDILCDLVGLSECAKFAYSGVKKQAPGCVQYYAVYPPD